MRATAGMTLRDAEHAVEAAHPGWHVWHTTSGILWATHVTGPGGVTLDAPTAEQMDHEIAVWEHGHWRWPEVTQ